MGFLNDLFGVTGAKQAAQQAAAKNRDVASSAYSEAQSIQNPYYQQGVQANTSLGNYLGLNGQGAQQQAFSNYVEGPDVAFRRQQGLNQIDNSYAARTGGMDSGALRKAQMNYGTNLATQDYGNFLQRLGALSGAGQNAANQLTNANYQSAGITSGANTAEGNAIANASLAGGSILGNLIGGGLNLAGNLGFNPFGGNRSMGGTLGTVANRSNDPWAGYR